MSTEAASPVDSPPGIIAVLDETRARDVAELALQACPADEAEAVILAGDEALTRFANNRIHQNVRERNAELRVRAVVDGRVGMAATNDLDADGIRRAARRAAEIARLQPPMAVWPGLPSPAKYLELPPVDAETAGTDPATRADLVGLACRQADEAGLTASGALSTTLESITVANSTGLWAFGERTRATWICVVLGDSGAGYSQATASRIGDLDAESLAEEAVSKAVASRNPTALDPGEYPVVLEPYAVATLVNFLGHLGFSGRNIVEGRSFLPESAGAQVAAPAVSLRDDHCHPRTVPMPFDFEGVPRQVVHLLDKGVAMSGVWDRMTAARAGSGQQSTGHALPQPDSSWGPVPSHLVLESGTAGRDELLSGITRGVYVTRFNYVRTVMPKQTVITGLTRDGTFLIEHGRLGRPIHNLRFTESVLDALAAVEAVGDDAKVVGEYGATIVPSLRVRKFRFTGATSY